MLYVGTLFDSTGGFIHSTGSDYVVEDSTLKSVGDDTNSVRYDGTYRLFDYLFDSKKPTVSVTILRPINSYYDSSTKKYKVSNDSVNSNISARVQLKGLRTEQYSRTYNATLNTNLNNSVKENLWSSSQYNSVNVGEEIQYSLYLNNNSKFSYCYGNGVYNSESECTKNGGTWKTSSTNSKTFENIIVTAKVPSNTSYVKCTGDYTCTYDKSSGTLTWTISKLEANKSTTIRYLVKVTGGSKITFAGFNVKKGSSGSVLNMDSIVNNVNPTIAKLNADVFRKEIKKFKTLAEASSPTIKYSSGENNYKMDLDNPTSANISGYGFHKNIYYNAMGIDLGYLSGTNIRDAIFNHDSSYNYAKKTDAEISALTNENSIKINKMLVKGFYGGRHLHGNDNKDRTGRLRISDLEFGDLIVYYSKSGGNNVGTSTMLMYVGTDANSSSSSTENQNNSYFVRFTSDNKVTLYTMSSSKSSYTLFNELYSKDLFVVLRPTQLYGTTVNYVGSTINGESVSVEYGTYKNLNKPTSTNTYNLTLNYVKSNYKCDGCKTSYSGGRTFDAWYKESTYKNKVTNGTKLASTSTHSLYAKWNYESITLPSASVDGYTIDGWYKNKDLTTKAGDVGTKYSLKSSDETLYAKWKANTYSVKYNANGGSGTMSNSSHTYDKASSLNLNSFYKDGYVFAGWSTTKGGSVTYLDGASVKNLTTGTGVVNLYAVWREKEDNEFVVTLNIKNGTADAKQKIVIKGNNVSFVVNPNVGYGNGSLNCNGGTLNGSTLTISNIQNNVTCTITYQANKYTIRYNTNGGTGTMKDSIHTYGVSNELTKNTFTKTGYKFVGWNRVVSNKVEYIDTENVLNVTDKSEVVNLYAVWKPISYEISYELNGGKLSNKISSYNVESNDFTLPKPTKKGYNFIGWTGSNGDTPNKDVVISKGSTGNKKYVANYEEGKYKIIYASDINGTITGQKEEIRKYKENPTGTTYSSNTGYKMLKFSVNKDVKLNDGTKILKNAPITMEQIKQIVVEEDLVITLYNYVVKYEIKYQDGSNGIINGITSEEVSSDSNPLGTSVLPNTGYEFKYWIADKDVLLKSGGIIIKGNSIIDVNSIVVKDNIVLSPIFEVGTYNVVYTGDENISIIGNTNEMVTYPNKLVGTSYEIIDIDYKFEGWITDIDLVLDNNETIEAGTIISEEQLKQVVIASNVTLKAKSKKVVYNIYYKSVEGIQITSTPKETVYDGASVKGVMYNYPDSDKKIVYISDCDVTLKDGTIIKAGEAIEVSQLGEIIVNEDMILTLDYESLIDNSKEIDKVKVGYILVFVLLVILIIIVAMLSIKKKRDYSNTYFNMNM